MTQIAELISQASKATGSDSATARDLGIPAQMVYMWKSGRKPCPPEDQAQLAHIAGLDPVQALIRAHLERHEGTPKGERLFSALGKRLRQTGAVSVSLIAGLGATSSAYLIRCILC